MRTPDDTTTNYLGPVVATACRAASATDKPSPAAVIGWPDPDAAAVAGGAVRSQVSFSRAYHLAHRSCLTGQPDALHDPHVRRDPPLDHRLAGLVGGICSGACGRIGRAEVPTIRRSALTDSLDLRNGRPCDRPGVHVDLGSVLLAAEWRLLVVRGFRHASPRLHGTRVSRCRSGARLATPDASKAYPRRRDALAVVGVRNAFRGDDVHLEQLAMKRTV
jgi:hypothetical protein